MLLLTMNIYVIYTNVIIRTATGTQVHTAHRRPNEEQGINAYRMLFTIERRTTRKECWVTQARTHRIRQYFSSVGTMEIEQE